MTAAWIGLGSNMGASASTLETAFGELDELRETALLARSRLYRSSPWGPVEQADFINAVAKLDTRLEAEALLHELQAIEARHGRERRAHARRWGPRTLDLDLLLYGKERIVTERLQVPHPRLAERAFVLAPLEELDCGLDVPGLGKISVLLEKVDASGVEALGA